MPPFRLPPAPYRTVPAGIAVPDRFDPRRAAHAPPPRPRKRAPQRIDAETVIARLEEAGHTLLCLPQADPASALRQTRYEHLAEAVQTYSGASRPGPHPPAIRITRMDQALAWILSIPAERLVLRRIVGCRCLVSPSTGKHLFSWRRLASLLGADYVTIRRWHAEGIDAIVNALKRDAALARSWDRLG